MTEEDRYLTVTQVSTLFSLGYQNAYRIIREMELSDPSSVRRRQFNQSGRGRIVVREDKVRERLAFRTFVKRRKNKIVGAIVKDKYLAQRIEVGRMTRNNLLSELDRTEVELAALESILSGALALSETDER